MSGGQTQSRSAAALRLYEGRLRRAEKEFDEAQRALTDAKIEFDAAERAYEAARHVFQAAEVDRARELGLDKIAPLTMSWIRALLAYTHAGTAELAKAADAAGWQADPEAIRQQASRLAKIGVLERVDRGVYRVSDRARDLIEAASPIFDQEHGLSRNNVSEETSQLPAVTEADIETDALDAPEGGTGPRSDSQPGPASNDRYSVDDEYDDDPAF